MAKKPVKKPIPATREEREIPSRHQVRIKVFGVGGGGGNAIGRMHRNPDLRGIEFIAINTDAQDLEKNDVRRKIHIGKNLTRGLGTGMNPDLGRQAAEENRSEIVEMTKGADLIFLTAGMGGGTGSGASPILAEAAREQGALTIAIVTRPFVFEGSQRAKIAEEAIARLREKVDALIVVPNDRIFNIIKKDTPILRAFERIDEILKDAIQGISELISSAGIINVDFADIRAIMKDAGSALVGVGVATGQNRASSAAHAAINSPLLEFSIEGARGILFGVSGSRDVKMAEINEIAKHITSSIDPSAKVIFGAYHDRKLKKGAIKVTLIATGFTGTPSSAPGELLISNLFSVNPEKEKDEIIDLTQQPSTNKELFEAQKKKENLASTPPEFKQKREEKKPTKAKKRENIWDIPAFLRRKKQ